MNAMGLDRFVITLRHAKLGKQAERRWDKDEAMRGMAWLKRMNARGYDVLIRPDGDHGLVLLKGLSKSNLETLKKRGFGPAAVVDAGSGSYQAWVRLSEKPLAERLRELAGSGLHEGTWLSAWLRLTCRTVVLLVSPIGRYGPTAIRRVHMRCCLKARASGSGCLRLY